MVMMLREMEIREESRAEGRAEGRAEARQEAAEKVAKEFGISIEKAKEILNRN